MRQPDSRRADSKELERKSKAKSNRRKLTNLDSDLVCSRLFLHTLKQQQSTQTTDHQTQYKRIEAAKELDRRCDETREKRNSLISHDRRFNILKRSLELNTTFDQQDSANQHTTDANEIIAKSRKCRHLVRPSSSQRAGPIELVYLEHGGVSAGSEQLQMEQQRGEHQSDGNEAANNLGGEARFCIACKGSFSENQSAGKASNHDGKGEWQFHSTCMEMNQQQKTR